MTFNFPENEKQVSDRIKTDIQEQLPDFDVFFKMTVVSILADSYGLRAFDIYRNLKILIDQMFPNTATGEYLERWGVFKNIPRNPSTKSSGSITIEGAAGINIPVNTQFQSAEGLAFLSTAAVDTMQFIASVSSVTRTSTTVTVTLVDSSQPIATGLTFTLSGADQAEYNVTQTMVVIGLNQFTYDIASSPATPATGTMQVAFEAASVPIESIAFGQEQNLASGNNISISSSISGLASTGFVQFAGVDGGTDIENDEDYRDRVIDAYQNPVAQFNKNQIKRVVRSIPGNTRVFIQTPDTFLDPITHLIQITNFEGAAIGTTLFPHNLESGMVVKIGGANEPGYNMTTKIVVMDENDFVYAIPGFPYQPSPATGTFTLQPTIPPGMTKVFFTRDNDENIIPSASEVSAAKEALVEQIMPVNTASVDLIVAAPTPRIVNFTFNSIAPNTSTMKTAIESNLRALFIDEATLGGDIIEVFYTSTIFQTIDPVTGEKVTDFDLASPSGDVFVGDSELAIIGTVTFL